MSSVLDLKTSLAGRLRNTNLPKSDALFPLFEAVVNSIHAIDDRIAADGTFTLGNAHIKVSIVRSALQNTDGLQPPITGFIIEDNGIGMNSENYHETSSNSSRTAEPPTDNWSGSRE